MPQMDSCSSSIRVMQRQRRYKKILKATVLLSVCTCAFLQLRLLLKQKNPDAKNINNEPLQLPRDDDWKNRLFPQWTASTRQAGGGDGGIIIFLHVPKTGGTTIRDIFSNVTRFSQIQYWPVYNLKHFRAAQATLEQRFRSGPSDYEKPILFVEIHGHNTPTLMDLQSILQTWKRYAFANNVPFFVFTLLRDPVDLAVSFFNFFHVFGDPRFGQQLSPSVENLRQTLQWNPQCLYLSKGERPYFRTDLKYNVTAEDCDDVAFILRDSSLVDWVGDTDRLSNETLPLLAHLVTTTAMPTSTIDQFTSSNVAATRRQRNRVLSKQELDNATIETIRTMTQFDHKLYLQTTTRTKKRVP